MRKKLQDKMFEISYIVELLISVMVGIAVLIMAVFLVIDMFDMSKYFNGADSLVKILDDAIILAIGVIVFAPFLQSFTDNALLKPAFAQVLPALFGALGAGYFIKHWRISFFPIIVMIIVLVFAGSMGASTLLFVGIVASVGGALFMYKKGLLDRVK